MMQDSLFNPETGDPSRGHANPESKAAHEVIKPSKKTDRVKIWLLIYESAGVGLTLEQLSWKLGRPASAISGRITELKAQGMVWAKPQKGETTSGCRCAIYVAK